MSFSTQPTSPTPPSYPTWLPILLGFLTAIGPLSTDMYLPAFPAIEASLGGQPGTAQITLATWFAGLAVGQLTQGSLADRYGRRRPLIVGTLVYTLANAACALAPDIGSLSFFRFVAAFGGSAGMVIPRAVVRDLADGHAAARLMSRLILVMGAAPILAPTIGGLVLGFANWHAIFAITAVYGLACALLVAFLLPETLRPAHRIRLGPGGMLARLAGVARDGTFLGYALVGGFGMFGMFAYIGGSPPVLIQRFGFSPAQYGMLFGLSAAMFIIGAQLGPRLLPRFGVPRVVRGATAVYVGAGLLMLGGAFLERLGAAAVVAPAMVAMFCMGLVMPNAAVGALSRHAHQAGSASALMGTIQFTMAAVSGTLVGLLSNGTAFPMASLLLLGGIGAFLADRLKPAPTPTRSGTP